MGNECRIVFLDPVTLAIQKTLAAATIEGVNYSYLERYGLAFSPDSSKLAFSCEGEKVSTMRVIDIAADQAISSVQHKGITRPLAFLSNDELVAIKDGQLATLDIATSLVTTNHNWFEEFTRRACSAHFIMWTSHLTQTLEIVGCLLSLLSYNSAQLFVISGYDSLSRTTT